MGQIFYTSKAPGWISVPLSEPQREELMAFCLRCLPVTTVGKWEQEVLWREHLLRLVKRGNLNEREFGLSPLMYALLLDCVPLAEKMLEMASPEVQMLAQNYRSDYDNILNYAGSEAAVRLLLRYGADVNVKSDGGNTPLHNARTPEVADALIRNGANMTATNDAGETPLEVYAGDENMLAVLLQYAAETGEKS